MFIVSASGAQSFLQAAGVAVEPQKQLLYEDRGSAQMLVLLLMWPSADVCETWSKIINYPD